MMNNTNNTGRNTIAQVLENAIKECQNVIKIAELENTTENTVCCTVDITEQLAQAKAEVERLESVISECEEAKRKTEEAKKKEKEQKAMQRDLRIGDEVVTIGGIVGLVVKTTEDTVVIECGGDRSRLRMKK